MVPTRPAPRFVHLTPLLARSPRVPPKGTRFLFVSHAEGGKLCLSAGITGCTLAPGEQTPGLRWDIYLGGKLLDLETTQVTRQGHCGNAWVLCPPPGGAHSRPLRLHHLQLPGPAPWFLPGARPWPTAGRDNWPDPMSQFGTIPLHSPFKRGLSLGQAQGRGARPSRSWRLAGVTPTASQSVADLLPVPTQAGCTELNLTQATTLFIKAP